MIPAGNLRHRVSVEIPKPLSESQTSRGRRDPASFNPVGALAAHLKPLTGQEIEVARQLCARATHRVWVRYPRTYEITTKHSFLFRERRYEIGHIVNKDEVNCVLECLCVEIAA